MMHPNQFAKTTTLRKAGLALCATALLLADSLNGERAIAAPLGGWMGEIFRWDIEESDPTLTWAIDSEDAAIIDIVTESFQQWEDVETAYVAFTQVSDPEAADILVSVRDTLDNPYAAGLSYPYYGNGDATITSCELQVLTSVLETMSSEVALQIFTHEIGHCLGLGHSVVEGALMSYRNPEATLTDDDRMAVTTRYPTGDAVYPVGCAAPPLATLPPPPSTEAVLARAFGTTGIPLLLMAVGALYPGLGNRRRKTPPLTGPRPRG